MKENTQKLNVQGFATRNKNIFFKKDCCWFFQGLSIFRLTCLIHIGTSKLCPNMLIACLDKKKQRKLNNIQREFSRKIFDGDCY